MFQLQHRGQQLIDEAMNEAADKKNRGAKHDTIDQLLICIIDAAHT